MEMGKSLLDRPLRSSAQDAVHLLEDLGVEAMHNTFDGNHDAFGGTKVAFGGTKAAFGGEDDAFGD